MAAKLMIRSENVSGFKQNWHRSLSPCEVWWGSYVAHRLRWKV